MRIGGRSSPGLLLLCLSLGLPTGIAGESPASSPKPFVLEGSIRAPDGSALAGVVVECGGACAVTGGDGRYRLEGLPRKSLHLSLRRGRVLFGSMAIRMPGPASLDIELPGGAGIRARVVDDDSGEPVAGALVRFGIRLPGMFPSGASVEATSGTDGRIDLDDLPPGFLFGSGLDFGKVGVEREGYLRSPVPDGYEWTGGSPPLAAGEPVEREIRITRGRTIRVRVAEEDGTAISGATVSFQRDLANAIVPAEIATTAADGSVALQVQPGCHGDLTAWAPGFAPLGGFRNLAATRDRGFPPAPGECVVWQDEGREVSRTLVLRKSPPGEEERDRRLSEQTRLGEDLRRSSRLPRTFEPPVPVAGPGAEPAPYGPSAVLRGVVISPSGKPVPGAYVLLGPSGEVRLRDWNYQETPVAAVTGENGEFRIPELPPGMTLVRVFARGFADATESGTAGGEPVHVTLGPASAISGRVLRDGGSAAGLVVTAWPERWGRDRPSVARGALATTGPEGEFLIPGLAEGTWSLETAEPWNARRGEQAPRDAGKCRPGASPVVIRLPRGFTLSGRVVTDEGLPFPGNVPVHAAGQGRRGRSVTRVDGTFVITGLEEGGYEVTAEPPSPWLPGKSGGVRTGSADLRIPISRGLVIHGRVLDDEGRSHGFSEVQGFEMRRGGDSGGEKEIAVREGMVRNDGTFSTRPLPPGTKWDLTIRQGEAHLGEWVLGVEAGARDVVLPLRRGGALSGRVLDADSGLPVRGAEITATAADSGEREPGARRYARTDGQGEFRVTGLGPWKYRVIASGPEGEYYPADAPEPLAAGARVELKIRKGLSLGGRLVDRRGLPWTGEGTIRLVHEATGETRECGLSEGATFWERLLPAGKWRLDLRPRGSDRSLPLGAFEAGAGKDLVLEVPED